MSNALINRKKEKKIFMIKNTLSTNNAKIYFDKNASKVIK